jgi:hypothetical protein
MSPGRVLPLAESPRDKLGDVERDHIEAAIRSAFAGVQLASGISLRQTQVISDYGRGYTRAEFEALPESEVTDDWAQIPDDELAQDFIVAHLDADGLRYYLPALMLWLLHHYDDEDRVISGADMTSIFTMAALAPDPRFEESYGGSTTASVPISGPPSRRTSRRFPGLSSSTTGTPQPWPDRSTTSGRRSCHGPDTERCRPWERVTVVSERAVARPQARIAQHRRRGRPDTMTSSWCALADPNAVVAPCAGFHPADLRRTSLRRRLGLDLGEAD